MEYLDPAKPKLACPNLTKIEFLGWACLGFDQAFVGDLKPFYGIQVGMFGFHAYHQVVADLLAKLAAPSFINFI